MDEVKKNTAGDMDGVQGAGHAEGMDMDDVRLPFPSPPTGLSFPSQACERRSTKPSLVEVSSHLGRAAARLNAPKQPRVIRASPLEEAMKNVGSKYRGLTGFLK